MNRNYLLIDQGNSRLKFRLVDENAQILAEGKLSSDDFSDSNFLHADLFPEKILICCSGRMLFQPNDFWPESSVHYFSHQDAGSISWAYPDTRQLGPDRMAAIMGARTLFPNENLVIADAGSCLTVDFLTAAGKHLGGFISPGYRMRLRAMHEFTHALPEITGENGTLHPGTNTRDCMKAGALAGIISEISGHFSASVFGIDAPVRCLLSGGDAEDLAHHLKESTFVAPDLIFAGLFSIRHAI